MSQSCCRTYLSSFDPLPPIPSPRTWSWHHLRVTPTPVPQLGFTQILPPPKTPRIWPQFRLLAAPTSKPAGTFSLESKLIFTKHLTDTYARRSHKFSQPVDYTSNNFFSTYRTPDPRLMTTSPTSATTPQSPSGWTRMSRNTGHTGNAAHACHTGGPTGRAGHAQHACHTEQTGHTPN